MLRFVVLAAAWLKLGDSQQCIPVTDMTCETTWSDYTACLAPDQDMTQGIASYKAQVAQMGCEVPPWYWQATVDSQMMHYRAGLIQYRQNHNLSPLEAKIRMPKMSRKKRQVDYEDDSDYVYQPVNVNNQVSAGCGFCARRIRCCKDNYQSWLDQNMQSDICEEYSDACEVPPMEDGSCDYALAMPKLMNDHINQGGPGSNSVVGDRLVNRLEDKWMSLLGATEPSMYCTKNGLVCNCCCGNYTAEPTEQGDMVCRKRRGPSGCGPNEVYQECSTSCQATCMEPNPTGCDGDQCKSIYAGCKCKPGMVRHGVNCIMPSQCPASNSSSAGNSNQNAATTMQGQGTTAAMPGKAAAGTSTIIASLTSITTTTFAATTTMQAAVTTEIKNILPSSSFSASGTTTTGEASGTTTVPGTTATSGGSGATTPSNSCQFSWSSPTNCQGADCKYQVTVTAPNPSNRTTILVQLIAVGTADSSDFWTGIGYSPTGKMAGSNATLVLVQSNVISVQDRSLGDGFLNALDPHQNAYLISGSYTNGVLNATVGVTCQQNSDPVNVCKDTFYPLYPTAPSMMKSKDTPGYHMTLPIASTTTYSFANCGV